MDMARAAKISISVARLVLYPGATNGTARSAAATAPKTAAPRFMRATSPGSRRPSEQSERAEREQDRHRPEDDEIGELGEPDLPEGGEHAHQQAPDAGADQAAAAA